MLVDRRGTDSLPLPYQLNEHSSVGSMNRRNLESAAHKVIERVCQSAWGLEPRYRRGRVGLEPFCCGSSSHESARGSDMA